MLTSRSISRLHRIDWDFPGSLSESAFSAIHFHPGRFASQIPATLIGLLSEPGDLVLDMFMGSGTTLVEAQRLIRRSVGLDLNPVASLIAKSKTLSLTAESVSAEIAQIKEDAKIRLNTQTRLSGSGVLAGSIPLTVQGEKWYSRRVLEELSVLWGGIARYREERRVLALAAFSSILLSVCREDRHWGYVCDNCEPKGRGGAHNVLKRFAEVLDQMDYAYKDRDADIAARTGSLHIEVATPLCADAKDLLRHVDPRSVDLVITSPPYFGVSDYVKSQRLSMEWFGLDIEPLRQKEIGARSKRHRKKAMEEYLADVTEVFRATRDALKTAGVCAVMLGESATRRSVFQGIKNSMRAAGFHLELEVGRRISYQRRQAPSIMSEKMLVLVK